MTEHYQTIGLQFGATTEEVKRAYRRLAMKFHPDRNPRGLERMKQINIAYEAILKGHTMSSKPATRSRRTPHRRGFTYEEIRDIRAACGCHCDPFRKCTCGKVSESDPRTVSAR